MSKSLDLMLSRRIAGGQDNTAVRTTKLSVGIARLLENPKLNGMRLDLNILSRDLEDYEYCRFYLSQKPPAKLSELEARFEKIEKTLKSKQLGFLMIERRRD